MSGPARTTIRTDLYELHGMELLALIFLLVLCVLAVALLWALLRLAPDTHERND